MQFLLGTAFFLSPIVEFKIRYRKNTIGNRVNLHQIDAKQNKAKTFHFNSMAKCKVKKVNFAL